VGIHEVPDAVHIAVGSTAMAVGLNALINSIYHLRRRNLSARVGTLFATFGVLGSTVGAYVGHLTSGTVLLAAFAVAMVAIGLSMFFTKEKEAETKASAPRSSVKIELFDLWSGFSADFWNWRRLSHSTDVEVAILPLDSRLLNRRVHFWRHFPKVLYSSPVASPRRPRRSTRCLL